ncbi:Coiled-coil domain-containing protein 134 [Geodia barretti]|uniref:Coiled-coil domain-containing protein 134 n=1 Tax=Geodia barretti TaxID=519541 RepID=A0AA35T558_GEOBA|nr:Coiled-coil domain-containing protein 134 [Geodia barretti]
MMAAKYLGLFYFSVLVAILAAVTADSTGRRKIPTRDGGHLSQIMMEEYLEDQNREVAEEPKVENASPLQLYLHLLRLKRKEQVESAEKVLSLQDFGKQYKTIGVLLETLFHEVEESLGKIEKSRYSPGMPFPESRELQEEVGKVYENVLMFGDFLLRMPEVTKKVYVAHKEWTGVFRWAVKFCLQSTDIFTGPYATHLHLMMQELGMGPKDPNYANPFSTKQGKTEGENMKEKILSKREAMQEKMKNIKGPKLRTNRHQEL